MIFIERPIRVRRNKITKARTYIIRSLTGRNTNTVVLKSNAPSTAGVLREFLLGASTQSRVLSIEFMR